MGKDHRGELYSQAKTLYEYIESNLYEDKFTEIKAKKALVLIHLIWHVLDRRG